MEEKKNKIGSVTVLSDNGEKVELEIVSAFQGTFKGDRRTTVLKTESDTYVLQVRRPNESGEIIEHGMHLTKESFAALVFAIHGFMEEERLDVKELVSLCMDDECGYLYKKNKEDEETFIN